MMQPTSTQRSNQSSVAKPNSLCEYANSVEYTVNSQSFNLKQTPRTVKNATRNGNAKINFGTVSMNASTTNTRLSRVQQKLESIQNEIKSMLQEEVTDYDNMFSIDNSGYHFKADLASQREQAMHIDSPNSSLKLRGQNSIGHQTQTSKISPFSSALKKRQ